MDVQLRDVPWDQALDIILRANKLGYIVDGTIVRIAPLAVLADEETQRRKLTDEQALAGQLQVLTKTLSYAKAEELQALLTKSALSQRGIVQVDPRTNTLIITDLPDRLNTANDLIATLDKPQPQVEIEARSFRRTRISSGARRAVGLQRRRRAGSSATRPTWRSRTAARLNGSTGTTQGPTGGTQTPTAVNLGVGGATSAVGLALGSVNGAFNLDVALSALETTGNGRILSTPRVTTQNNIAAEITQGTQIPIQTVSNNTVTVELQGRGADPQSDAANHRGEHRHHDGRAREQPGRLHAIDQRYSPDQHAARDHERARQRRPDDGHRRRVHLRTIRRSRIARRASAACRCSAGCSSGISTRHPIRNC